MTGTKKINGKKRKGIKKDSGKMTKLKQMTLEEGLRARKADGFPGVKQQKEADEKVLAAKTLTQDDREALKVARQEEDTNKKALLVREKENYTKIYVLKCYNGWLKICDNSAMMVSKKLDGKLGRTYEVSPDAGYGVKAAYGVISIPPAQVGDFVERLARAGITLDYEGVWVLEFGLGERVSQEEMVRMLHEDELMIERTNKLVMPRAVVPGLRADVKLLLEFVHTQVRNQKDSTKEIFLNDVERRVIEANRLIIATARGCVGIEECLDELGKITEAMYEDATTMCDMKLTSAKQYKEHVDLVTRVEMERAREIKRMVIARADAKVKKTRKRDQGEGATTVSRG